jgi:hypothetical protein
MKEFEYLVTKYQCEKELERVDTIRREDGTRDIINKQDVEMKSWLY